MIVLQRELRTNPINTHISVFWITDQCPVLHEIPAQSCCLHNLIVYEVAAFTGYRYSLYPIKILTTRVLISFVSAQWLNFTYQIIRNLKTVLSIMVSTMLIIQLRFCLLTSSGVFTLWGSVSIYKHTWTNVIHIRVKKFYTLDSSYKVIRYIKTYQLDY